jgi:phospholipase A1
LDVRLFGKNFPTPPIGVAGAETAALSVQSLSIRSKDEIELVIAPSSPVASVKGKVVLERTDGPDKPFAAFNEALKVSYAGPPIPVLKLRLPATNKPGFYRARFVGKPFAPKPAQFAVTGK